MGILRLVSDDRKILEAKGETIVLNQDLSPHQPEVRQVIFTHLELDEKGNRKPTAPSDSASARASAAAAAATAAGAATTTSSSEPPNDTASRIDMAGDHYLGVGSCKDCHVSAWAQWSNTTHARAYESLASGDDWNNHECLPCHVTGYGQPGGHASVGLSPELWNVQCEECHGMGTLHTPKAQEVAEATCLRCHTPEMDADFDFARDIVGMIH
jgi:hypothetical protein